jgi:hypothetical protein
MIKVPYEDCLRFIENYLQIELLDFQKILLKHICNGEIIYGGRGCGRSTVVKGYTEYLSRSLDRNYPKREGYYAKVFVDEEPYFDHNI